MNKNTIITILTKLKNTEIDLDEAISYLEQFESTEDLINELDMLYEIESKAKYTKKLEELILDISSSKVSRAITHKDLRCSNLIKPETVDSLNALIHEILKETK